MNKYQFANIFSIFLIPVMFIGYEISFNIISKPIHFVFLNKFHLALIIILFIAIAFAVFESFRKILQGTKFSNIFISIALTTGFVLFGVHETLQLVKFSEQIGGTSFTPSIFFMYNFILGLVLTSVIASIIALPVWWYMRKNSQ